MCKMKKYLYTLFLSAAASSVAHAQLLNYGLMPAVRPLAVNPAATGQIAGDVRVAASASTWRPAELRMVTPAISCDMPLLRNVLPKGNQLGLGIVHEETYDKYVNGRSSSTGLSLAYSRAIGRHQHIAAGMQGVFHSYDMDAPSVIVAKGDAIGYHAGVLYDVQTGAVRFHIGYATQWSRIIRAQPAIDEEVTSTLYHTLTAGITAVPVRGLMLHVMGMYNRRETAENFRLGGYGRLLLNGRTRQREKALYVGCYKGVSVWQYVAPYVGFEIAGLRPGISWVLPRENNNPRWLEASLIYNFSFRKHGVKRGYMPLY